MKLEPLRLATDNTGTDVTLTAAGLETANSHSLSFHQIKLIDAGRFGGTLDLEASAHLHHKLQEGATNIATADPLNEGLVNQL